MDGLAYSPTPKDKTPTRISAQDWPRLGRPYDEIFTIQVGRARFTVGDEVIDAEAGDIVFGPANIPHGYQNLGPGRLDSLDIHLSAEWVQYDLGDK